MMTQTATDFRRVVDGTHHNPHAVLGAHPTGDGATVIRTLRPNADAVAVVVGDKRVPMAKVYEPAVFEAVIDGSPSDYRLAVTYGSDTHVFDDPYRWLPTLGEIDLHLIGEGRHENLWQVLGAHLRSYDTPSGPVTGTSFAVWAPNARGIRVTGDFDYWSGWSLPMRSLGSSGVWELFVPGVEPGARYKFRILGADSVWREKADPMAFATEVPPATASVVFRPSHEWGDGEWLERRASTQWLAAPMSVYEVHLGSWRPNNWRPTSRTPASPTSSSCRSPNTRTAGPGDTRCRPTTRPRRGSAIPTSSVISSTDCTKPASA
jgi:1,4-alpha-glucan branching enzyme